MIISRRNILKASAALLGAFAFQPPFAIANSQDWRQMALNGDRWLSLKRESSGEEATFMYYRNGHGFLPRGYAAACHLLRDVKYNATVRINPKLIDLLYLIQFWLRANDLPHLIVIMSGYRTSEHNASLSNAAKLSEHVKGNAADIRIPGVKVRDLEKLARAIGVGGVGVYPNNGFIHVDVGRVRQWVG